MPNWCITAYAITGKKEEIDAIHTMLLELEQQPSEPGVSFGNQWLGNVVKKLGGDPNEIYCRGEFYNLECHEHNSEPVIRFDTMTAWGELNEVWDLAKKVYPSINYYWRAEEPGNIYYATNDAEGKFFPERFMIEQFDSGAEYYETMEKALEDLSDILERTVTTWEDAQNLINEYNKTHEDNMLGMVKFAIVTPETK